MSLIKTLSAYIAIFLMAASLLAILVDGVAIILAYISMVFALLAAGIKKKYLLATYGVLFVAAHFILIWRISSDITRPPHHSVKQVPHTPEVFIKCSNEMFKRFKLDQILPGTADNKKSEKSTKMKKWLDECLLNNGLP